MNSANPNPRYDGKPLLRLLECYVLWSIDELSSTDSNTLEAMTPKLQQVYGVQGEWQVIVAAVMEWPPKMPKSIQKIWAKNRKIARKSQASLSPQQFAEMFVDQNFAS